MSIKLTMKAVSADALKKVGGRKAEDTYLPILQAFANGDLDQVILEEASKLDEKGQNKLIVALKTTRTRHSLPVRVIQRNKCVYLAKQVA